MKVTCELEMLYMNETRLNCEPQSSSRKWKEHWRYSAAKKMKQLDCHPTALFLMISNNLLSHANRLLLTTNLSTESVKRQKSYASFLVNSTRHWVVCSTKTRKAARPANQWDESRLWGGAVFFFCGINLCSPTVEVPHFCFKETPQRKVER